MQIRNNPLAEGGKGDSRIKGQNVVGRSGVTSYAAMMAAPADNGPTRDVQFHERSLASLTLGRESSSMSPPIGKRVLPEKRTAGD